MDNGPKTDLTRREQKKKIQNIRLIELQAYKIMNLCADPVLDFIMR